MNVNVTLLGRLLDSLSVWYSVVYGEPEKPTTPCRVLAHGISETGELVTVYVEN